ncbi:hypothetical protein AC578_5342 [Pseudocercospora eumusae]|uniref:DUF7587 domain-containing protein n=1 Tax=Pseudocercospora eumusae TaxID=321146 RepID=A0A139H2S7_9PEZI|nr:hypothetical protein AC578_5342 [Pseudocercospora eumusae]
MVGVKRPSPEAERDASKSNKRPLLHAIRLHPTTEMTGSEDESDESDQDLYQTDDEESCPEAAALLEEFLRELTSDYPKPFSRNDALAIALLALPRFLFRVAGSSKSRGLNNMHVIDPLFGWDQDYHKDIRAASNELMRSMIMYHTAWNYKVPSEFSSWTVSLLWVLIHARRKYREGEKDIIIYVMDTSKLPSSRIHKATDLLDAYNLEWLKKGQTKANAVGEWLIHGKLTNEDGLWRAVKFQNLIHAGFKKILPELRLKPDLLHMRAIQLRHRWFAPNKEDKTREKYWNFPRWTVKGLRDLARCFGPDWEAIVMAALIALRRRDFSPEVMKLWKAKLFRGMKLPRLPWNEDTALRSFHLSVSGCRIRRSIHDEIDEPGQVADEDEPESVPGPGDDEEDERGPVYNTTVKKDHFPYLPEVHQFMILLRLLHDSQQEKEYLE